MEITVECVEDQYCEVLFKYTDGNIHFEFAVTEPGLITSKEWTELVSGDHGKRIFFYQGNGEGSVTVDGDKLLFVSHPSGDGGDTISTFKISKHPTLEILAAKLDEIQNITATKMRQ